MVENRLGYVTIEEFRQLKLAVAFYGSVLRDNELHEPGCAWWEEEKHYRKMYDYLPASRSECDCWLSRSSSE